MKCTDAEEALKALEWDAGQDKTASADALEGDIEGGGSVSQDVERVGHAGRDHKERLEAAKPLSACMASSEGGRALVRAIVEAIVVSETRGNGRGQAGLDKLERAVTQFVGGVLRRHFDEGHLAYRPMGKTNEAFPGSGGVSWRQAAHAVQELERLGLIKVYPGFHWHPKGDDFVSGGRVTRFEALPALIEQAATCGVTGATIMDDFRRSYPKVASVSLAPVILRPLSSGKGREPGQKNLPLPAGEATEKVIQSVEFANAVLSGHEFTGCLPPRLHRVFHASFELGGRWYADGGHDGFTQMTKRERKTIRVDGQPLVEIDVNASHLTLAHVFLGFDLPSGDLYDIPGMPRDLVKLMVVVAFGRGKLGSRTSPAAKALLEQAGLSWGEAVAAICGRYPFLQDAGEALSGPLGLGRLRAHGTPQKLLVHRLMALEADALGTAAWALWSEDIPALPLHDALLVAEGTAPFARQTMELAFHARWGITPRLKTG